MRFLSMVRLYENTGQQPSERLMNEMGKLIDEMTKSGVLLDSGGLRPTSEGARVKLSGGKVRVVDGPFAETKEVIGGFAILEAASMEEAIALTRRFVLVHGDEWELDCEVRQIEGPDFDA